MLIDTGVVDLDRNKWGQSKYTVVSPLPMSVQNYCIFTLTPFITPFILILRGQE